MTTLVAPYPFDGQYAGARLGAETAMDPRHIFIMHEVLCSWPFKNALELGSFNGASATAFVEAINSGKGLGEAGIATFCDVCIRPSLINVARGCKDLNRTRVSSMPSWAILDTDEDYDFIFVDAGHDLDSVSVEVKKLLRRRPLCVMAHDTNATAAGYPLSEGAEMLKETFRKLDGYHCVEDCFDRPDERTNRGLFLATSNLTLFAKALAVFEKWT